MERKYRSDYTQGYKKNKNVGHNYDKKISNKFELLIWDVEKKILRDILNSNKIKKKKYLDFACGSGRLISFCSKFFKNSTGVDTSPYMLKEARKKCNANFIEGNIITDKNLLENKKFDVITSFRLFLNIEDKNRKLILKELYKYLNDDGVLIINNHINRYSLIGFQFWIRNLIKPIEKRTKKNMTINTASELEFKRLINDSGFKIEKIYRFMILPGRKDFVLLPKNFLVNFEYLLSKIPFINLIGKDQIYLCRKNK